jgi:hypothetical protein
MQKNHTARIGTVPVISPLVNDPKYLPAPGANVWTQAPSNNGTSIRPPGMRSMTFLIFMPPPWTLRPVGRVDHPG